MGSFQPRKSRNNEGFADFRTHLCYGRKWRMKEQNLGINSRTMEVGFAVNQGMNQELEYVQNMLIDSHLLSLNQQTSKWTSNGKTKRKILSPRKEEKNGRRWATVGRCTRWPEVVRGGLGSWPWWRADEWSGRWKRRVKSSMLGPKWKGGVRMCCYKGS